VLWFIYTLAVVLFSLSFFLLKILHTCRQIIAITLSAIEVMANHLLDDQQKQNKIQQSALGMLIQFLVLLVKGILVLGSVLLPFYAADYFSLVSIETSSKFAMRVDVILMTTIAALAVYFLWKKFASAKVQDDPVASDESAYSNLERVIHNVAFGSADLQRTLNNIEKKWFSKNWLIIKAERPIFVTSLARAGTTVLLESLSTLPNIATHTYRDMPFIFSPVLWSKLSSPFQNKSAKKQRAHGDGLMVNEDSPEAFEEVIWVKFFPQKYLKNKILLWQKADKGFLSFFYDHMQRIIFLRLPNGAEEGRYLSKNNANISRIPVLQEMFPDCSIVVPLRDPLEHAISLYRQHVNFSKKHVGDTFTKKYMQDIGHFEFGDLHRLIDFPEIDKLTKGLSPNNTDYWLAYWLAAYRYLETLDGLIFVSYDALCEDSELSLASLCERISIEASEAQIHKAAKLLKRPPSRIKDYHFSNDISESASQLYEKLKERSV
jgi:hypothetical protein